MMKPSRTDRQLLELTIHHACVRTDSHHKTFIPFTVILTRIGNLGLGRGSSGNIVSVELDVPNPITRGSHGGQLGGIN